MVAVPSLTVMDWNYADEEPESGVVEGSSLWSRQAPPDIESESSAESSGAASDQYDASHPAVVPASAGTEAATAKGVEEDEDVDTFGPSEDKGCVQDDGYASGSDDDKPSVGLLAEDQDPAIIQLERDILATCNGLRLLSVEDAAGASAGTGPKTVFILTKETLLNLHDVATLLRQNSQLDSNSERAFAVELLLLNPKYTLLETAFMPVWAACLDTEDEGEYLEKLIFIFARVLIPPDKTWKHRHIPHRVQWYLKSVESVKKIFMQPVFWKGLNHAMHRLSVEIKDKGRLPSEETRRLELLRERDTLRQSNAPAAETAATAGLDPITKLQRLDQINEQLAAMETGCLRRYQSLQSQLMTLRTLLLCLLRLGTPLDPLYATRIAANITAHGLWDLFESEWRHFVSEDLFARSRRNPGLTATLWRILDFYGRLLYEIPPSELLRHTVFLGRRSDSSDRTAGMSAARTGSWESSTTYHPVSTLPVFQRHTKFNPILMRQRLQMSEGEYVIRTKRDKLPRLAPRRRRLLKRQDAVTLLPPDIYDVRLRPLGQPSPFDGASGLLSVFTPEHSASLFAHLQSFIRLGLNGCIAAWITDCIAEDETLDEYDPYKVVNLMAWILNLKRRHLQHHIQTLMAEMSAASSGGPPALLNQLVEDVLALRSLLDTNGIHFVYRLFHTQVKKGQLRHQTDYLAKLCLRTLTEQLLFGILLMQEGSAASGLPEALKIVGQCVVEDIFKCNLITDIVWILRTVNASSHDYQLVLYAFEAAFLLLHCFTRLGGSAAVAFGRGQRRLEAAPIAAAKTRRVDASEFLDQLSDGRIVKTIMKCLRSFRTNGGGVNRCLARLLLAITRDSGGPHAEHMVVLCFQLSYFDLFSQILHDRQYRARPDSAELVRCVEWIVLQFWEVFRKNKFCIVELLFGKAAAKPFSYADPHVLLSVYTNYEEGLDHEYLHAFDAQSDVDDDAAAEWRRQREAKLRAERTAWTAEETRQLMRFWDVKKKLPHALRQVRHSMKSKRSVREIRAQLVKLGVLEFDGEELPEDPPENGMPACSQDATQAPGLPLLRALLAFRHLDLPPCEKDQAAAGTPGSSPHASVLSQLLDALTEIVRCKRDQAPRADDFLIDLPSELPLERSDSFGQLMHALGAVRKPVAAKRTDSVPSASDAEHWFWFIDARTPADDLKARTDKLHYYLNLPEETLHRLAFNAERNAAGASPAAGTSSGRLFEQLCKLRIVTMLLLFKVAETTFDWSASADIAQELEEVLTLSADARTRTFGGEPPPRQEEEGSPPDVTVQCVCEHFGLDATQTTPLAGLALPDGIALRSLVSAVTAGLEHLSRKRKQYILTHGTPIASGDRVPLGQLVFPVQPPESSFGRIVEFIRSSTHPLLERLLESVGFEQLGSSPEASAEGCPWVLPLSHTLQRIDTDIHYLRVYTMTNASMLTNVLKRLSAAPPSTGLPPSQRSVRRETPLLVVESISDAGRRHMAKATYKLRACGERARLEETMIAALFKVMIMIEDWNGKRPTHGHQDDTGKEDHDLIIQASGGHDEEFCGPAEETKTVGQFKDMLEFQHCLLALLGRCDNVSAPTEWYWSRGCTHAAVNAHLAHAKLCLHAPLKTLKKYAKGRISEEELRRSLQTSSAEDVCGPGGAASRADMTAYSTRNVWEEGDLPQRGSASPSSPPGLRPDVPQSPSSHPSSTPHETEPAPETVTSPNLPTEDLSVMTDVTDTQSPSMAMVDDDVEAPTTATTDPTVPRSLLDDDDFLSGLLEKAAEEFVARKHMTAGQMTEGMQHGLSALLQLASEDVPMIVPH